MGVSDPFPDKVITEHTDTHGTWDTRDELHFLYHLGQWSGGLFLGRRLQLLRGYREGLERRTDWNGLDRGLIVAETEKAIAREVNQQLRETFA